jgi:hypothetical protein
MANGDSYQDMDVEEVSSCPAFRETLDAIHASRARIGADSIGRVSADWPTGLCAAAAPCADWPTGAKRRVATCNFAST